MTALISIIMAALPNAFIAVLSKLVTQKMLTAILEKVVIYSLEKVASMTTNTLDDELVQEIKKRFETPDTDDDGGGLGW